MYRNLNNGISGKRRTFLRSIGDLLWCEPKKYYPWWFFAVICVTGTTALLSPKLLEDPWIDPLSIPDLQELVSVEGIVQYEPRLSRIARNGRRTSGLIMTTNTGGVFGVPEHVMKVGKHLNISQYHGTQMRFLIDPKNNAVWQVEQGGMVVAPYSNRLFYVKQSRKNTSNSIDVFLLGIFAYVVLVLLAERKRRTLPSPNSSL